MLDVEQREALRDAMLPKNFEADETILREGSTLTRVHISEKEQIIKYPNKAKTEMLFTLLRRECAKFLSETEKKKRRCYSYTCYRKCSSVHIEIGFIFVIT
jgi:hypothetical protein